MADYTAAGLLDRGQNGVFIERTDGAEIDQLNGGIALLGGLCCFDHHGAPSHHREVGAFGDNPGLANGQRVGLVGHGLPESAVDPLGLEENHRVWISNGCDQQSLGVVWRGGHHHFQSRLVGVDGFWSIGVKFRSVDATTVRDTYGHRNREATSSSCAESRGVRAELVVGRAHESFELKFGNGSHAVHRQSNGTADDARFSQR